MTTSVADATAAIPGPGPARTAWLKYQLALKDSSFAAIGRDLGFGRTKGGERRVQIVVHRPYPRIEAAIAKKLGLKPETIWPERYTAKGVPNQQRRSRFVREHFGHGSSRSTSGRSVRGSRKESR